ncbi:MAG TPA: heme-binding protein [Bryobacteraceae bacterium]|nr:heme-binding protein [Bryobacteraceae bacterium]
MLHSRIAIATVFFAALCGASGAAAQGLVAQKSLSAQMAMDLAQGALDKCREQGYKVSVTVVNAEGLVKVFVRDDGAAPHTIDLSKKKAFTAVTQRNLSGEVAKQWGNVPPPAIDGIVTLAGGVPIKAGNEVIAAIGVSGAPAGSPAGVNDEICANAGIAKIAARLK